MFAQFRFIFDEDETGLEDKTGLHEDERRPHDGETRLTDHEETRLMNDGETRLTDDCETGLTNDCETRWTDDDETAWMEEVEIEGRQICEAFLCQHCGFCFHDVFIVSDPIWHAY